MTKRNIQYLIWGLIYWIILLISFAKVLQIHWHTALPLSFSVFKLIIATIAVFLIFISQPAKDDLASFYLLVIAYLVIIPMGVIYVCQSTSSAYFLLVVILSIILNLAVPKITIHHITVLGFNQRDISKAIIYFSVLLLLLTAFSMYRLRGLPSMDALDFSLVYDIRSSYTMTSEGSILYQISSRVIVPFLLAISVYRRRYLEAIALLFFQLLLFLWLAHKTVIFSIGILVIAYYLAKNRNRRLLFSKAMIIIVGIISLAESVNKDIRPGISMTVYQAYSLIIRRTLFVPAHIKNCYYEYFVKENHPLAGFFGTIIAPILTRLKVYNPYESTAYSKVVGMIYEGGSNANTGLYGKELAHFGFVGLIVAVLCLLIFLGCVKSSELINGVEFTCILTLYLVVGFTDDGSMALLSFSPLLYVVVLLLLFNFKEYQRDVMQSPK